MLSAHDAVLQRIREQVLEAGRKRQALRILGGGSKLFYGNAVSAAQVLDLREYSGILAYDPAELVLTARAGTPLAEIEAALAERSQMLAFEPPRFGAGTLGGCIAAGLSGPRRSCAGAARDFVLGATLLDGHGRVLRFGGQVMKNVAGYDVARLLAGSLGSLGVIVDVSIKLLPQPFAEASLRQYCSLPEALTKMNRLAGRPLPLSASSWHQGVLHLRLSGARAGVDKAISEIGGERLTEAQALTWWQDLRDQQHAFFSGAPIWRLALPSMAAANPRDDAQLVEWGGALRWQRGGEAAAVRAQAQALGGHACAFRGHAPGTEAFTALKPSLRSLHQRLKQVFDPAGIFNPGILGPGL